MSHDAKQAAGHAWPAVERRKLRWAADWQSAVERDKATLAQSLHDNTGGLLVAAVMDISWVESRLSADTKEFRERLIRARAALDVAIDLNRRTIEELRPTLLDNFGLITALKWHFTEACKSANVTCEQRWPDSDPAFSSSAAIALFRVAQTLIALMISHEAQFIAMALDIEPDFITFRMQCKGAADEFKREDESVGNALASVTGRVKALGGDLQFDAPSRGAVVICRLPQNNALIP